MTTIPTMEGAEGGFPSWDVNEDSIFSSPLDVSDVGLPPIYTSSGPSGPSADELERDRAQQRLADAQARIDDLTSWKTKAGLVWDGILDGLGISDPATRPDHGENAGLFDFVRPLTNGVRDTVGASAGAVTSTAGAIRSAAPLLIFGLAGIVLWRAFKWKA